MTTTSKQTSNAARPQPTRRERERLARRQYIIDAATSVFARRGYADTTLDEVAERAEFGKASLYSYFATKEELFGEVIATSFGAVRDIAASTLAGEGEFEGKLERFVRAELEYFYRNPERMHLMRTEAHHLRGANPMIRLMPELLGIVSDVIALQQKDGTIQPRPSAIALSMLLINLVFGRSLAHAYERLCGAGIDGPGSDDARMDALLEELRNADQQSRIAEDTDLIVGLFLRGVSVR